MSEYPTQFIATSQLAIFPIQIKMICEARSLKNDIGQIGALNMLLITANTTFLEDFISSILDRLCDQSFANTGINRIHQNIITQLKKDIYDKGFSEYQKIIKTLTGKEFAAFAPTTWKTIRILFQLRNKLAHGRTISVAYYEPGENKPGKAVLENMSEIQAYLNEKKLLPSDSYEMGPFNVIANKVVYHFIEQTYKFIEECHKNLTTEFKIVSVDMLDYAMTELGDILQNIKDQ
jgi:hypothetical protein